MGSDVSSLFFETPALTKRPCHSVHPQVHNRWLFRPPPSAENTGVWFDSSLSADTLKKRAGRWWILWSLLMYSVLYRAESFPTITSAPQDERRDVLNTVYRIIMSVQDYNEQNNRVKNQLTFVRCHWEPSPRRRHKMRHKVRFKKGNVSYCITIMQ